MHIIRFGMTMIIGYQMQDKMIKRSRVNISQTFIIQSQCNHTSIDKIHKLIDVDEVKSNIQYNLLILLAVFMTSS